MNRLLKRIAQLENRISILEAGEKIRAVERSFPVVTNHSVYVEMEDPSWPDDRPLTTGKPFDAAKQ